MESKELATTLIAQYNEAVKLFQLNYSDDPSGPTFTLGRDFQSRKGMLKVVDFFIWWLERHKLDYVFLKDVQIILNDRGYDKLILILKLLNCFDD